MRYTDGYYNRNYEEAKNRAKELRNEGQKAKVESYHINGLKGKHFKVTVESKYEF